MRLSKFSTSIAAVAVFAAGCTIPGFDPFAVSEPKNLTAVPDPCHLLKLEQVQSLNAGKAAIEQSLWGQSACVWRDAEKNTVRVAPDTVQGNGIVDVARNLTPDGRPNHEISGYPAVRAGDSSIRCSVYVAPSEKHSFIVAFSPSSIDDEKPEFSDACKVADNIALMVLNNLPPQ